MKPGSIPKFSGYDAGGNDFDRARTGFYVPFRKIDIDLSFAPPAGGYFANVEGDFFYVDLDPNFSNGVCTVELNQRQDADQGPIYLLAGIGVPALFKGLKFSWAVQAGKKIRILYATGARVLLSSSQISAIGSITAPVSVQGPRGMFGLPVVTDQPLIAGNAGYNYATSFSSGTLLAANTPGAIIAAPSNINGFLLGDHQYFSICAAVGRASTLAKATAPTTIIDGDVLGISISGPGSTGARPTQGTPGAVRVSSGKRLDHMTDQAETSHLSMANYVLL